MEIEERVARVESNNRLLAIGVIALVALVGALVTAFQARVRPDYEARLKTQTDKFELAVSALRSDLEKVTGGKVVRASQFQVVDEEGKVLVELTATEDGHGAVTTYDRKGTRLVTLTATDGGKGAVATFNRGGEVKNQWP